MIITSDLLCLSRSGWRTSSCMRSLGKAVALLSIKEEKRALSAMQPSSVLTKPRDLTSLTMYASSQLFKLGHLLHLFFIIQCIMQRPEITNYDNGLKFVKVISTQNSTRYSVIRKMKNYTHYKFIIAHQRFALYVCFRVSPILCRPHLPNCSHELFLGYIKLLFLAIKNTYYTHLTVSCSCLLLGTSQP